jgi:hypothetical protein
MVVIIFHMSRYANNHGSMLAYVHVYAYKHEIYFGVARQSLKIATPKGDLPQDQSPLSFPPLLIDCLATVQIEFLG